MGYGFSFFNAGSGSGDSYFNKLGRGALMITGKDMYEGKRVRILARTADDFFGFDEHFVNTNGKKFFALCTKDKLGECEYCEAGDRPSSKIAVNVIDQNDPDLKVKVMITPAFSTVPIFRSKLDPEVDGELYKHIYRVKTTKEGGGSKAKVSYTIDAVSREAKFTAEEKENSKTKYDLAELFTPSGALAVSKMPDKKETVLEDTDDDSALWLDDEDDVPFE